MYVRLWWKETRLFWPIWVALGVIAAGVQWLLLWSKMPEARSGFLIVLGFVWSMIYAIAVGAGVLAGDRESKTQVFLDTLPVARRMQWTGKVSFALATTLGLTLALSALGAMGTAALDPKEYPLETLLHGFGLLLLEGVAWSVLWSVVLGSSLQAAIAGVMTVGLLSILMSQTTKPHALDVLGPLLEPLVAYTMGTMPRLVLACVALRFSWLVFTREPGADRAGWVRQMLAQPGPVFERLIWETVREVPKIWLLLAGSWVGLCPLATLQSGSLRVPGPAFAFTVLALGVTAGVSVFGSANGALSCRFLAYHGVRPGAVWAARLLVWGIVMAGILSVAAVVIGVTTSSHQGNVRDVFYGCFVIFEMFVIGVLAGQVLRRSITAWVVATLAFVLLVVPQFALYSASMIPSPSLALFPLLVLTISWAWTSDWMNDFRGAGRWFRLGGMMGAAAALWFSMYIGYRALSVPDIGSPFPPRPAAPPPGPLAPGQDAAPDYMRLFAESPAIDDGTVRVRHSTMVAQIIAKGWDPTLEPVVAWWEARRGQIERIRRAAAKPEARFPRAGSEPYSLDRRLVNMQSLLLLLGLDGFERRSRGDLAGAWDDLRAAFQIAEQLRRFGRYNDEFVPLSYPTQILQWALAWAGDSRQTPAQLRAALAELPALLRPASLADSLEYEYTRSEHSLRRDPDALIDLIQGESESNRSLRRVFFAPWWERIRTLRVLRLMTAMQLKRAELERWQRNDGVDADLEEYRTSTPLARALPTNDRLFVFHDANSVLSRALEQVTSLRIWQLEHDGHYPETLEALVPGLLQRLPPDPYSGQPFRYRRSKGQMLLPLGLSGPARTTQDETSRSQPSQPGQWLLYSVGPNRIDEEARRDHVENAQGDFIFPLPP